MEDEGTRNPSDIKKIIGMLVLMLTLVVAASAVTFVVTRNAYADGKQQPKADLIQVIKDSGHNRVGVVVGSNKEQTCLVLLNDDFSPVDRVVCVANKDVLNYQTYAYGPSVLPALGDRYDVRYFTDLGISQGIVLCLPGACPTPKVDAVPSTPGVDVPTATPEK